MLKVSVIGTGNVGTHLCVALSDKVDELVSVNSHTLEDLPLDSDIYIYYLLVTGLFLMLLRVCRQSGA